MGQLGRIKPYFETYKNNERVRPFFDSGMCTLVKVPHCSLFPYFNAADWSFLFKLKTLGMLKIPVKQQFTLLVRTLSALRGSVPKKPFIRGNQNLTS